MKKTKILVPVYNDWQSAFKLLEEIDAHLEGWEADISVIIINDASLDKRPFNTPLLKNLKSIHVVNMKKNKGHARCNAAGLKYIDKKEDFDFVIVMDGDGEDRPAELGTLLCKGYENPDKVITADRVKRSEGLFFKFCYFTHKFLTFVFTGKSIKFGNYSCLPKFAVNMMIKEPATWSSFSGSLAKTIQNRESIPSTRGERYFGPSKMSFFNLLKHSLSIVSVFRKAVLIRSALFIVVYILMIKSNASVITAIPLVLLLVMIYSISSLALRENMDEFKNDPLIKKALEVFKGHIVDVRT